MKRAIPLKVNKNVKFMLVTLIKQRGPKNLIW